MSKFRQAKKQHAHCWESSLLRVVSTGRAAHAGCSISLRFGCPRGGSRHQHITRAVRATAGPAPPSEGWRGKGWIKRAFSTGSLPVSEPSVSQLSWFQCRYIINRFIFPPSDCSNETERTAEPLQVEFLSLHPHFCCWENPPKSSMADANGNGYLCVNQLSACCLLQGCQRSSAASWSCNAHRSLGSLWFAQNTWKHLWVRAF